MGAYGRRADKRSFIDCSEVAICEQHSCRAETRSPGGVLGNDEPYTETKSQVQNQFGGFTVKCL